MSFKIEPEALRHLWPKAPQAKIDAICSTSEEVFSEHGIDDPHVVAQLMANISHECGAGTIVRESGNYRDIRIVEVFGAPKSSAAVTPAEARDLAHKPEALFERVYNLPRSPKLAKDLGNHQPGDGYKFRGGGDLQLTGRYNYERIGKMTGHPEIAENPDLLSDPAISFKVAVAEFVALGCVAPAKKSLTSVVRRKVNGGTNGLGEVEVWVRKWEEALPDVDAPEPLPRGSDAENTKSIADSPVVKGSIGAAIATGGTIASTVSNVTQQASDTVTQVQGAAENVHVVVKAVHPVLGLMPQVWEGIGIACGLIALVAVGYIVFQHWQTSRKARA
jgi:putative chitinase